MKERITDSAVPPPHPVVYCIVICSSHQHACLSQISPLSFSDLRLLTTYYLLRSSQESGLLTSCSPSHLDEGALILKVKTQAFYAERSTLNCYSSPSAIDILDPLPPLNHVFPI